MEVPTVLKCPSCSSDKLYRAGKRITVEGLELQRYLCRECNLRFSEPNPYKLTKTNSEQQLGVILQEAKKLQPQQKTDVVAISQKNPTPGAIIDYLWYLKKQGRYSDATIATRVKALKFMAKKGVNLNDPEAIKLFIAQRKEWSNGHKQIIVFAYNGFAEMLG